jgi:hypothetical protein
MRHAQNYNQPRRRIRFWGLTPPAHCGEPDHPQRRHNVLASSKAEVSLKLE